LYLLLFNARQEAAQGNLEYWLDTIGARVPKARVLVVATQCDERPPQLDYRSLKARFENQVSLHDEMSIFRYQPRQVLGLTSSTPWWATKPQTLN
jgi:hypothetical protein